MTGLEAFNNRAEMHLANVREMVVKPTTALAVVELIKRCEALIDGWYFDEASRADAVVALNAQLQETTGSMACEEFMRGNYRVDYQGQASNVVPFGMTEEEVINRG